MQMVVQSVDQSLIGHYCRQLRNLGFVFDRVLDTVINGKHVNE